MEKHSRFVPDKLLRIEKRAGSKTSHATATRILQREIHDSMCAEPKCRFFGKPSQQGICHTTVEEIAETRKMDRAFKDAKDHVKWVIGKARKPKEIVVRLASEIQVMHVNEMWTLDELVKLRAEVAILRDKLEKQKRRRKRTP